MIEITNNKNKRFIFFHEKLAGAIILSIVGGFLEAHTFLLRGGVFCNAQTGNIVFMIINLCNGNFLRALYYPLPIFAFIFGILLSRVISSKLTKENFVKWEQSLLLIEASVLLCGAFIPLGTGDQVVCVMVSFVCSLQYNTFRQIGNTSYTSVFCTNNLRQATENFHKYLIEKDSSSGKQCLKYLIIIVAFCLGVALQTILAPILNQYSLFVCSGLLLLILSIDFSRLLFIRKTDILDKK